MAKKTVVNIVDYGAQSGENFISTSSIQNAIDDISSKGGGKVIIPKGFFVSGTIFLKKHVTLYLEKDAVLAGSIYRKDYDNHLPSLIAAEAQEGMAIAGEGTIDGRGAMLINDILQNGNFPNNFPPESARTHVLLFVQCKQVHVSGVTIKNATTWVTHYERCNKVRISHVNIESVVYWNNDGIDLTDCKNVRITHCNINAADDAICLKSNGKDGAACENIFVAHCRLRSSANAFKLGTASRGGFKNIRVKKLDVYDTYRAAVALESVDGGSLHGVKVKGVHAVNTGAAIFIRLGHRNKDAVYSTVEDISIKNLYAEVPAGKPDSGYAFEGPLLRYPPGIKPAANGVFQSVSPWNNRGNDPQFTTYQHNVFPSSVTGLPGHHVKNVTLQNIRIVYAGGADEARAFVPMDSLAKITEAEAAYPEFSMFGELPAWGLYLRHATGIRLKHIALRFRQQEFRTAVAADDVQQLSMKKLQVPSVNDAPVIVMHEAAGASIKQSRIAGNKTIKILQ